MEYSAFRFRSDWDKIGEIEGGKGRFRSSSAEGGVKGDGRLRDKGRRGGVCGRRGRWCLCVCLSSHTVEINLPSALWNKEREMLPGWLWTQTRRSRAHKALMFKK